MNERIRELIVSLEPDAFMTYKGYLYHSSDPKVFEHSDPEPLYTKQELVKFAELIVEECAEIGDNYQDILGNEPECANCRKVAYGIVDKIKQHFGVEE